MTTFANELRQAWRSLLHRKAYFLTCAGTLTLVLGANAAMFAVVECDAAAADAVRHQRGGRASVRAAARHDLRPAAQSAAADGSAALRERARTLARLEGYFPSERVVTRGGEPGVAQAAAVTPGLLTMMAAPIAQGRSFLPERRGARALRRRDHRSLLARHARLGAACSASPLVIDGQPHTIVGVLAPAFAVPFLDAQIFTPLVANPEPKPRSPPLSVVGLAELAPGASLAQAARRAARDLRPVGAGVSADAQRLDHRRGAGARVAVRIDARAAADAARRHRVRAADRVREHRQPDLGAGRRPLGRAVAAPRPRRLAGATCCARHLAELLIVCASGLVPGLLLAWAAVPALLAIDPTIARTLGVVAIDWRVQVFSAIVAILTAIAASAVPAIRAMRGQMSSVDRRGGARTTGSPAPPALQRALVSIEVALCLALLMAGAVLVQGLRDLSRRSPGYESAGVLTAQIRLPDAAYKTPDAASRRGAADARRPSARCRASCPRARRRTRFVPGFLVSDPDQRSRTARRRTGRRTPCSSAASAPTTSRRCGSRRFSGASSPTTTSPSVRRSRSSAGGSPNACLPAPTRRPDPRSATTRRR